MRCWSVARSVLVLAFCWYASLAVHEAGHALAGLLVGAETIDVELPLLGFSQTVMSGNDHPLRTTAAGLFAGAALPVALWLASDGLRAPGRRVLRFWAGFALVLNGGYLVGDAFVRGGDGGELIRHGAPAWLLIVLGLGGLGAGLWVWHGMGRAHTAGPDAHRTT